MAQGHYRTLGDCLKGIRQALRDEFGDGLADQDFKFNFDEDAKRVTITIKEWSCLALNPWMTNLLHSGNFVMYGLVSPNDDLSNGTMIFLYWETTSTRKWMAKNRQRN